MSNHPNIYQNLPDAMSGLLSTLKLKAEVCAKGNYCGNWALDTSGRRMIPFHLVAKGHAWLHFKNREPQRLNEGDFVLFPQDDTHIVAHSDIKPDPQLVNQRDKFSKFDKELPATNVVCGGFDFLNKMAWPLLDALDPVIILNIDKLNAMSTAHSLIQLMITELKREQQGSYIIVNQLAYLIFIEVIRYQIDSGKVESGLLAALFDPKISKALQAIHNTPEAQWSVKELAEKCAMGRSSFASKFNELVGMPPMQYLTTWRMQKAVELLEDTTESIFSIATQSGYETETAFRKAFKKEMGLTPGQIRQGHITDTNHIIVDKQLSSAI